MAPASGLGLGRPEGFIQDLAVALCKRVDLYGFGLFGSGDSDDLLHVNWYDTFFPIKCAQSGQCLHEVITTVSDMSIDVSKKYCRFPAACEKVWESGPKSPDPMDWFFKYELRTHILEAFGFANWLWD